MKKLLILIAVVLAGAAGISAQNISTDESGTVYVEPLFQYPEAPPFLDNLYSRADWLMDNFWNDMNFKQKTVHQAALQHAFEVYATPMRWATKAKVLNSIDALMKKVEKNPGMLIQIMKAAEETFHSPRSEMFIDEVYERFLQGFIDNKKVKKDRKARYIKQLEALRATAPGSVAPQLALTDSTGNAAEMPGGKKYTLIVFGSPSNTDLRQWLLRLNSVVQLEEMAKRGDASVVYVSINDTPEAFSELLPQIPPFVSAFRADRPQDTFDIRITPSTYLLDSEGKVMLRNSPLQMALGRMDPD